MLQLLGTSSAPSMPCSRSFPSAASLTPATPKQAGSGVPHVVFRRRGGPKKTARTPLNSSRGVSSSSTTTRRESCDLRFAGASLASVDPSSWTSPEADASVSKPSSLRSFLASLVVPGATTTARSTPSKEEPQAVNAAESTVTTYVGSCTSLPDSPPSLEDFDSRASPTHSRPFVTLGQPNNTTTPAGLDGTHCDKLIPSAEARSQKERVRERERYDGSSKNALWRPLATATAETTGLAMPLLSSVKLPKIPPPTPTIQRLNIRETLKYRPIPAVTSVISQTSGESADRVGLKDFCGRLSSSEGLRSSRVTSSTGCRTSASSFSRERHQKRCSKAHQTSHKGKPHKAGQVAQHSSQGTAAPKVTPGFREPNLSFPTLTPLLAGGSSGVDALVAHYEALLALERSRQRCPAHVHQDHSDGWSQALRPQHVEHPLHTGTTTVPLTNEETQQQLTLQKLLVTKEEEIAVLKRQVQEQERTIKRLRGGVSGQPDPGTKQEMEALRRLLKYKEEQLEQAELIAGERQKQYQTILHELAIRDTFLAHYKKFFPQDSQLMRLANQAAQQLDYLETEVSQMRKMVDELVFEKQELEHALVFKDKQITYLTSVDPSMHESSAIQLGAQAIMLAQDGADRKAVVAALEREVEEERAKKEAIQLQLDAILKNLAENRHECASLVKALAERDARIADLESEIQQKAVNVSTLQTQHRQRSRDYEEKVSFLSAELRIHEAQHKRLCEELSERDGLIVNLKSEVVRQSQYNDDAEKRIAFLLSEIERVTHTSGESKGSDRILNNVITEQRTPKRLTRLKTVQKVSPRLKKENLIKQRSITPPASLSRLHQGISRSYHRSPSVPQRSLTSS